MKPHRPSPSMIVALIALTVALGGTSYAAVKLPKNSVSTAPLRNDSVTSAKVKDRSLKATDFARGALPSGAKGDTGAAGPTGPQGPQGPQGDRGPAGPVAAPDTSNFYDKTASDARFLGIGAQAADADKLDGLTSSQFVHGSGSRALGTRFVPAGSSGDIFLSDVAAVHMTCSDPASATIRIAMNPGVSAGIFTDNGAGTTTFESVGGGGSSTAVAVATQRHVAWRLASGLTSIAVDGWVAAGPGGANTCLVETRTDVSP